VGGNRWKKEILTWWPEGRNRKWEIRNEVGKGSGNSDETIQTRKDAEQAKLVKSD
jgi:hypothetical protein